MRSGNGMTLIAWMSVAGIVFTSVPFPPYNSRRRTTDSKRNYLRSRLPDNLLLPSRCSAQQRPQARGYLGSDRRYPRGVAEEGVVDLELEVAQPVAGAVDVRRVDEAGEPGVGLVVPHRQSGCGERVGERAGELEVIVVEDADREGAPLSGELGREAVDAHQDRRVRTPREHVVDGCVIGRVPAGDALGARRGGEAAVPG